MGDIVAFNPKTPTAPGRATWAMARAHMLKGGRARRDVWWDSWLVKWGSLFCWQWHNPDAALVSKTPDTTYSPWGPDQDATDWVLE